MVCLFTVSHHLSCLSRAGLVSDRAQGYSSIYQLETKTLEEIARSILAQGTLPAVSDELDLNAYDRKGGGGDYWRTEG